MYVKGYDVLIHSLSYVWYFFSLANGVLVRVCGGGGGGHDLCKFWVTIVLLTVNGGGGGLGVLPQKNFDFNAAKSCNFGKFGTKHSLLKRVLIVHFWGNTCKVNWKSECFKFWFIYNDIESEANLKSISRTWPPLHKYKPGLVRWIRSFWG